MNALPKEYFTKLILEDEEFFRFVVYSIFRGLQTMKGKPDIKEEFEARITLNDIVERWNEKANNNVLH